MSEIITGLVVPALAINLYRLGVLPHNTTAHGAYDVAIKWTVLLDLDEPKRTATRVVELWVEMAS